MVFLTLVYECGSAAIEIVDATYPTDDEGPLPAPPSSVTAARPVAAPAATPSATVSTERPAASLPGGRDERYAGEPKVCGRTVVAASYRGSSSDTTDHVSCRNSSLPQGQVSVPTGLIRSDSSCAVHTDPHRSQTAMTWLGMEHEA